jgi:ABC-type branched-subunit amino acid transport system substrate-binding protein
VSQSDFGGSSMRVIRVASAGVVALAMTVVGIAPSSAATTTTTKPFKVLVISDMSGGTTGFTTPEVEATVKGALKEFPAAQVTVCDSKSDPNEAKACAREAVDGGYAAVIIGYGTGSSETATLTAAGLPVLGQPNASVDGAFATASGLSVFKGMGAGLKPMKCKNYGMLALDGIDNLNDQTKAGAASVGVKEVARATVATNSPDQSPAVAKLVDAGAQCITLAMGATQLVQAMTAINQTGKNLKVMAPGAVVTKSVLDELGPLSKNLYYVTSELSPDDSDRAAFKQMRADINKVDKSEPITSIGIHSYVASKLLEEAAKNVQGDVTKESLLASLNAMKEFDAGELMGPISMTPLTNPTFKHLINPWVIVYTTKNGKVVRVGDFLDISSLLKQA